jgi:RNA polymerase sigma-70 factor (ECF subfamily)
VELVQRYEPAIRTTIRARLCEGRLRRLFGSADNCQSVLASFFVRAELGRYELRDPDDLKKLLIAMARHKVINHLHRQEAGRRDLRRLEPASVEDYEIPEDIPSPSQVVATLDLPQEARRRLFPDERHLLQLRDEGTPWNGIARSVGEHADALRMKMDRAIDRVAHELGLVEPDRD